MIRANVATRSSHLSPFTGKSNVGKLKECPSVDAHNRFGIQSVFFSSFAATFSKQKAQNGNLSCAKELRL